jgi:glycosyltransferase A (GT-A) superfamily protein (DUF2064 family)
MFAWLSERIWTESGSGVFNKVWKTSEGQSEDRDPVLQIRIDGPGSEEHVLASRAKFTE